MRSSHYSVPLLGLALVAMGLSSSVRAEDIKVTVVAILASTDKNAPVDPELEAVAAAVRKNYPDFTGFRVGRTTCLPVAVGKEAFFPLVDDVKATVEIVQGKDKKDRIRVKVKPPMLSEVSMSCCCEKFVPFVTPYVTKTKGEQLIIAVMVNPCQCK